MQTIKSFTKIKIISNYEGKQESHSRNLTSRVEVYTSVYDHDLRNDLMRTVDYGLRDNVNGRIVDGHGTNAFPEIAPGEKPFRSQEELNAIYNPADNNEQQ